MQTRTYVIVNKVGIDTLLLRITFERVGDKGPVTMNYPINNATLEPI